MNIIQGLCPNCLQENVTKFPCHKCNWKPGENNKPPFLPLGTILDRRYIIAKVLGNGGFGVTYLAWENNLKQQLAIKEFFPRDAATRATDGVNLSVYSGQAQTFFEYGLERFLEEARILAKFDQDPCIVSTKTFFKVHGTGYMVMEYVDGITMRQYLTKAPGKRIPVERAVALLTPVMNALRNVHKEGLLHRDIAPDNIYITHDNKVKLLDFGAARFATGEQSKSLSVILKPGYAPEEQYRTRGKQGPWTDVYALAATLYRAITGKTPPEALDRLSEDELIPPSKQGVGIFPAWEAALLKALAVKAPDRFPNIGAFQRALQVNIAGVGTQYTAASNTAQLSEAEAPDDEVLDTDVEALKTQTNKTQASSQVKEQSKHSVRSQKRPSQKHTMGVVAAKKSSLLSNKEGNNKVFIMLGVGSLIAITITIAIVVVLMDWYTPPPIRTRSTPRTRFTSSNTRSF